MIIKRADALKWIAEHPQTQFAVKFKKKDGSIRLMECQTQIDDGTLINNPLKFGKPKPVGVVYVYDTQKKEYRSFREDSLMSVRLGSATDTTVVWQDIEEARVVSSDQIG